MNALWPIRAAAWLAAAGCAVGLPAQTATGGAAQAPGPAPPIPAAMIRPVLATLDAAFARGDVVGHGALFRPDHFGAHLRQQLALQRRVATTASRERKTELVTEPRTVGPRTVVRVRHDYRLQGGPGAAVATFAEEALLALHTDPTGAVVPTLLVSVATNNGWVREERLRCPACNYEVGGVSGWLCAQQRRDVASALEAATFWLVGTDVAVDVSVQVEPEPRVAATVAAELAATMQRLDPTARAETPVSWTPPAHAASPVPHLTSARVEFALDGGERAQLHVVAFGGLQHLLLVRGSAASLRAQRTAVDALLASYRLLERDCDVSVAMARPLEHHGLGTVHGTTYSNPHYGVELEGPDGWRPTVRTGGAAFRVVWTSPSGSRLWLTGHEVPLGMSTWTQATADRWLQHLCEQQGLTIDDPSVAWCDDVHEPARTRTLVCTAQRADRPDAPRRRSLRLVLHDDLLLIADGFARTAADEGDLQRLLRAVARR